MLPNDDVKTTQDFFSAETDKIIPAFVEFQHEIDSVKKNSNNPFYKSNSKYADLSEIWKTIKEPLYQNKLSIVQFPMSVEFVKILQKQKEIRNDTLYWNGKYNELYVREIMLVTYLMHESGQWYKNVYIGTPDDNDNQSRGKCITYCRRYSIMAICGICPEDDDGNPLPKTQPENTVKQVAKGTDKQQTKANVPKKTYVYDKNGVARFCINDNKFNDDYQMKNKLITTTMWHELENLIRGTLGGNNKQFEKWLDAIYQLKVYDMPSTAYAGIVKTITENPEQILGFTEVKDSVADEEIPF